MPLLDFNQVVHSVSLRMFTITIENAYLDKASITCGVSQGSILGPLFFLLYINDMPEAVDSEILLYTNDSCLFFQRNDIKAREEHLNRDFSNLIHLFVDNKLSVHFDEDKTKSIFFSSKQIKEIGQIEISYKSVKINSFLDLSLM